MTSKQLTRAVAKYARKHGYSASTVRTVTVLRLAAIREIDAERALACALRGDSFLGAAAGVT